MQPLYIQSISQISAQKPFDESWIEQPIQYGYGYHRSIDPDFKDFFSPNEARRMGRLLKRAIITSREVIKDTQVLPDAIITGTGLGCIDNTEILLKALSNEGESISKPACFMQSTHNTISSLVGIDLKCHGYNTTYSHKGISFECALLDATMQLSKNDIHSVLVGAHDEMTPDYFTILQRIGYLGGNMKGFSSETSVSMLLEKEKSQQTICRIDGIEICYCPTMKELFSSLERLLKNAKCPLPSIDGIMIGVNGNSHNDNTYSKYIPDLFGEVPLLRYKHLFGESYTAPALGFYTAAICLKHHYIPSHLFIDDCNGKKGIKHILLYNQFEDKNHTLILLSCSN